MKWLKWRHTFEGRKGHWQYQEIKKEENAPNWIRHFESLVIYKNDYEGIEYDIFDKIPDKLIAVLISRTKESIESSLKKVERYEKILR